MKVSNIALYGGFDASVADSYAAKEHLDTIEVTYSNLFYNDPNQFPDVLNPINSWFPDKTIKGFPFVVWDETNDKNETVRKVAVGLKEIKAANLKPTRGSVK